MDETAPIPEALLRKTERAVWRDVVSEVKLSTRLQDTENEPPIAAAPVCTERAAARCGALTPSPPPGVCVAAAEWFTRGRVENDEIADDDDRREDETVVKTSPTRPKPTLAAIEEELARRCEALADALGVSGADPSALLAAVQAAQARASFAGTSTSSESAEQRAVELRDGVERAANVVAATASDPAGTDPETLHAATFSSSALAVERASVTTAEASAARARAAAAKLASSAAQVRAACCGAKVLGALRVLASEVDSAGAEASAREACARREVALREALGPAYRQLAARHAKVKRAARDAAFQLEQLEIAGR